MRVFHHTHSSHNSNTIPTTAKNLLRHAIITGIIIVGTMQVLFSKVFRMLLEMNGSLGRLLQSKSGSVNQSYQNPKKPQVILQIFIHITM